MIIGKKKLGELTQYISRGITPKYVDGEGLVVLNQKCIRDNRISLIPSRLTDQNRRINNEKLLRDGDLLINSTGTGTLGRTARYKANEYPVVVDSHISIVRLKDNVDSRYVGLYLSTIEHIIANLARGATNQVELSPASIAEISIPLPNFATQQKIADIILNYNELVECNSRRIELLEESARLLYRDWFVHLRFPGHEHIRITKGVPDGWGKKALNELTESIDYGYTASANKEEIGPKFLRITDIVPDSINWSRVPYCEIKEKRKNKYRLCEGDVVVARTGATVGYAKRIHRRNPESVFASYLVRFRFKEDIDNMAMGIFMESDDYKNYVKSNIGGAAQPNANAGILSGAKVLIPERKIRDMFKLIIEPIVDQKEVLQVSNQALIKARDILVPRVMNGELVV